MIDVATGIGEKHVSTARQMLVRYGLIAYDGKTVLIDWVRIAAFALLDAKAMGQKKNWNISPVSFDLLCEPKTGVHNYIGTGDQESKRLYAVYEATQQAIADGVRFPELEGSEIAAKLLGQPKTGVHNYLGIDNLVFGANGFEPMGWYNPFDEPDPDWAADIDALPF